MFPVDVTNPKFYVNYRGESDKSLLHLAVQQKNETQVEELIKIGCDVNAEDDLGQTPILYANFSNTNIIKCLLDGGAYVNVRNESLQNPLYLAIKQHCSKKESCLGSVHLLLHAGIDIYCSDIQKDTVLDTAVQLESLEIVEVLIQNGAEVNRNDCLMSALSIAAASQNEKLFQLLLYHGADVDYENEDGTSPLLLIYWLKNPSIISAVIERTTDINRCDADGYNILHYAVTNGNTILVQLLLEGGADVSVTTQPLCCIALHLGVKALNGCHAIVEMLLRHGANVNYCDYLDSTPLLYALEDCDLQLIRLLSNYGADFTATDIDEDSALHFAAKNPRKEVMTFILDKGFDINSKNQFDETALHIAVKYGGPDVCNLLLDRGADIRSKDEDENSPLSVCLDELEEPELECEDYATMKRRELVAFVLIAHIAKLNYLNFEIDQDDLKQIKLFPNCKRYYQACKRELNEMTHIKVYRDVTVFDILFASEKDMRALARNENLVTAVIKLDSVLRKDLSIYFSSMIVKFEGEVYKERQVKKAQKIINDIMGYKNLSHPVCRTIARSLKLKDLEQL